ncbi:MAG: hypothetical protein KKF74_00630, partial [Nanoarchaeota archaeon]|nr:hypothetical protein [Nanoarchaeota archaeon]
FLKKKKEEEEKTDIKQEVQIPEPQESEKMLTELPEFPTMEEEDVSPLPKIEPLNELENSEINMPSLGETFFGKAAVHPEKSIAPEFGEFNEEMEEQETEEEIELPIMLTREDTEKKVSLPAKVKVPERRAFNPKKPVFVNVRSYQGISNEINVVINVLENSEEVVKRLNNIKIKENNELKKMHDSLEGLNKKIIAVDDILSKG